MFDLFDIVFLLMFGVFLFTNIKEIHECNKNNNSPKLTIDAKVVAKRSKVTNIHREGNGLIVFNKLTSIYYVTFQIESNDKIEMLVNLKDYKIINEGDCGKLTLQGTKYISFEKENI